MVDNTQDNSKPGDYSDYKQYPLFLPKATDELPRSTQLLFEYGASAEGYFNTEAFIRNQFAVLMLFEFKFETERLLCIYDNSTVHRAMGEGALDANAMNLSSGGKQKPQHRTEWDGKMQEIGTKGIKIVLEERGMWQDGMKKAEAMKVLSECKDFKEENASSCGSTRRDAKANTTAARGILLCSARSAIRSCRTRSKRFGRGQRGGYAATAATR